MHLTYLKSGETLRSPIAWFTPLDRPRLGQSRKPGPPSRSPMWGGGGEGPSPVSHPRCHPGFCTSQKLETGAATTQTEALPSGKRVPRVVYLSPEVECSPRHEVRKIAGQEPGLPDSRSCGCGHPSPTCHLFCRPEFFPSTVQTASLIYFCIFRDLHEALPAHPSPVHRLYL